MMALGMAIGALVLAYVSAGDLYEYQDTVDGVHLPHVDAIVVLAGGRGRIAAAGDLWYRYWELGHVPLREVGRHPAPKKPPILYLSGMGSQFSFNSLSLQVRRGVFEVLKTENVVLEKFSTNTEGNAKRLAEYAYDRKWERILLVTSPYHMRRAKLIFEGVFWYREQPVHVETLSVYQEPFDPNEWRKGLHGIEVTLTEYLKWVFYKRFWRPDLSSRE